MKSKRKYRKLIRILTVLLTVTIAFGGYVEIVNLNTNSMTARQKILKAIYPAWSGIKRVLGKGTVVLKNSNKAQPKSSFYDLSIKLNDGSPLSFREFRGKKVLLVNTASDCGNTPQYGDLEKLYEGNKERLIIIGFPANDFHGQEKRDDEEIAQFCKKNFGISFPLAKKASVVKGSDQQAVFQWLSDSTKNGWNTQAPTWNFSKYLVNEQGVLTYYFGPSVSPSANEIVKAIE